MHKLACELCQNKWIWSLIKLTVVLLDLGECEHLVLFVAWQVFQWRRGRHKLDCVGLADDFSDVLGLEVLFADVAGLVVKETMWVAHPGHAAEENSRNTHKAWWKELESVTGESTCCTIKSPLKRAVRQNHVMKNVGQTNELTNLRRTEGWDKWKGWMIRSNSSRCYLLVRAIKLSLERLLLTRQAWYGCYPELLSVLMLQESRSIFIVTRLVGKDPFSVYKVDKSRWFRVGYDCQLYYAAFMNNREAFCFLHNLRSFSLSCISAFLSVRKTDRIDWNLAYCILVVNLTKVLWWKDWSRQFMETNPSTWWHR